MSDLISRQNVYDALEQYDREHVEPVGYDDYYNGFLHIIESLPSADRTTGHIVTKCSGKFNPTVWAECSECGNPIDAWDKFCRHCGARMEATSEI